MGNQLKFGGLKWENVVHGGLKGMPKSKKQPKSENRFRGRWTATLDSKGRMKIPVQFRETLLKEYGADLFITTIRGEHLIIYPLSMWTEVEERITQNVSNHVRRYQNSV